MLPLSRSLVTLLGLLIYNSPHSAMPLRYGQAYRPSMKVPIGILVAGLFVFIKQKTGNTFASFDHQRRLKDTEITSMKFRRKPKRLDKKQWKQKSHPVPNRQPPKCIIYSL